MSLGKKILYFTKEALLSLRMNRVMSAGAVITVFLCLLAVSAVVIFSIMVGFITEAQRGKVEIEVFVRDAAPTEQVQALQNRIASWEEVSKVKYVSKEEALKKLRKWLKDSPEVLRALSGNPLPASYQIRLRNPQEKTVDEVVKRIKKQPNIGEVVNDVNEDIKYGKGYINKLFAAISLIQWIMASGVILLCFVALILIVNTIRIAIFARRKEIAVMRLVGASSWFIRWPFILEGVFEGLIGALLAMGILYIFRVTLFRYGIARVLGWFGLLSGYSGITAQLNWLMAGLVLGGMAIGAIGSGVALRRFLKV